MRGRVGRVGFATSLATLAAVGVAGCGLFGSSDGAAFEIAAQVQIDQNGDVIGTAADQPEVDYPVWSSEAACPPLSIAMLGPLTGPDAALGIDVKNGAQLAVDQHNAAVAGCQVQLKAFDTTGNSETAVQMASEIVRDVYTMGVIGPVLSDEVAATGDIFNANGMVAVTPSATAVALADRGWQTFFRGLANDGVQGIAIANYMTKSLGATKVCVVDDGTGYGQGLSVAVRQTLGPTAAPECAVTIAPDTGDFTQAIDEIRASAADSVFFAGYYTESGPFVRELRDAGVTASFVTGDGSKNLEFVELAGDAAQGAVLSCPCGPPPPSFVDAYTAHFDQAPGSFSAGSYDLGAILLRGIDAEALTRPELLDFVRNYQGEGLERFYRWADNGELTTTMIWVFRVQ